MFLRSAIGFATQREEIDEINLYQMLIGIHLENKAGNKWNQFKLIFEKKFQLRQ